MQREEEWKGERRDLGTRAGGQRGAQANNAKEGGSQPGWGDLTSLLSREGTSELCGMDIPGSEKC